MHEACDPNRINLSTESTPRLMFLMCYRHPSSGRRDPLTAYEQSVRDKAHAEYRRRHPDLMGRAA